MNNSTLYKFLRYTAQALAIYLIFRFLPEITDGSVGAKLTNADILMITAIIMLIYILFESLCNVYEDKKQLTAGEKAEMCSSVCAIQNKKEPFTDNLTSISDLSQNSSITLGGEIVNANNTQNMPSMQVTTPAILTMQATPMPVTTTSYQVPQVREPNIPIPSIMNADASVRSANERMLQRKYEQQQQFQNMTNPEEVLDVPQIQRDGSRSGDDLIMTDMQYDTDYNHLPMATGYDSRDYEYGYSFLPPEKWYPQPNAHGQVCISEKTCPVCPISDPKYADLKDWNDTTRVTGPDNINSKFIVSRLNSGRYSGSQSMAPSM